MIVGVTQKSQWSLKYNQGAINTPHLMNILDITSTCSERCVALETPKAREHEAISWRFGWFWRAERERWTWKFFRRLLETTGDMKGFQEIFGKRKTFREEWGVYEEQGRTKIYLLFHALGSMFNEVDKQARNTCVTFPTIFGSTINSWFCISKMLSRTQQHDGGMDEFRSM